MPRAFARLLVVVALALSASTAVADSFTLRIGVAPPPPRIEHIPPAPSPGHFWVNGYWRWNGHAHAWVGGHWVKARPGETWVHEHWAHRGNEWFFYPGHWVRESAPAEGVVIATGPPPAVRAETVPPPPGPESFWVAGHWRWENNAHVWAPGHWEARRA
ncbi:MAG TPA: YXWGXW repeat-containing protein, partial [Thermoanaerobaculia bacterium]|nr:YXWGXW repeat-containing protein [Thermoanaerobaculia bacterium]